MSLRTAAIAVGAALLTLWLCLMWSPKSVPKRSKKDPITRDTQVSSDPSPEMAGVRPDEPTRNAASSSVDYASLVDRWLNLPANSVAGHELVELLRREYRATAVCRQAITLALQTILKRPEEDEHLGHLLKFVESADDLELVLNCISCFGGQGEYARPRAALAWRDVMVAESLSRGLFASAGNSATATLVKLLVDGQETPALILVAAEVLLWRADEALLERIQPALDRLSESSYLRALVLLAQANVTRSFDGMALVALLEGPTPNRRLEGKVIRASMLVLPAHASMAILRLRARGTLTSPDVLGACQQFLGTREGREREPELLHACLKELSRAESAKERRVLSTVAYGCSMSGPVEPGVLREVRKYLSEPSINAASAGELAARANLMTIVTRVVDMQEVLEWAAEAVRVADFGVLLTCLNRIERVGIKSGYFSVGAPRAQLIQALETLFAEREATRATAIVFEVGVRIAIQADMSELYPSIRRVRDDCGERTGFEGLRAACQELPS